MCKISSCNVVRKISAIFTPEWWQRCLLLKVMVRINEATRKGILLTAWHLVGHSNSRAGIIIVRMCNNYFFFGHVLVHLNGELCIPRRVSKWLIHTDRNIAFPSFIKSIKKFVIPLNRKILEVYKNLASTWKWLLDQSCMH